MSETDNKQAWTDFYGARKSYERLLLLQPQIRVGGLWQKDHHYFVVCPDLKDAQLTRDGQPLDTWWHNSARTLGVPMQLVSAAPAGAVRLPERSITELAELRGTPLTVPEIESLLAISLPSGFPAFRLETTPTEAFLYVESHLTPAQTRILNQSFEPFRANLRLKIVVDPARAKKITSLPIHLPGVGLDLITSKSWTAGFSAPVKAALEEDEDFWVRNRTKVFAATIRDVKEIVPKPFRSNVASCLVDATVAPPTNLRTYLSLYSKIIIVMPLDGSYSDALAGLHVTEDEVIELASRGRLQFLLPQSVHRYPPQLVARLAELNNRPILLSRRLAALTVCDARRRIPLLYPPFGIAERRGILEEFLTIAKRTTPETAEALAMELGQIWSTAEEQVHFRGAMMTGLEGIGRLLAAAIKTLTGRDVLLEMYQAASSVEWAAALNASVFPIQIDNYSGEAAVQLCASAYSGVPIETPSSIGSTEIVVRSLLALDDDASVIEVANTFSGHDTDRLRKLVFGVARSKSTAEQLQKVIAEMNQRVQEFDARVSRQTRVDLVGLTGALVATGMVPVNPPLKMVALGGWILKYIFQNAEPKNAATKRVVDWLRAANAWTSSDVVLVSRLRKVLNS